MSCSLSKLDCVKYCKKEDKTQCKNWIPDSNAPIAITTGQQTATVTTATQPNLSESTEETAEKRQNEGAVKNSLATQFSGDRQPAGEAKSAGWKKKNFTRDTIRAMMNIPFTGNKDVKWYKDLADTYGEDMLEGITWGQLMTLKQQMVATEGGSTHAYNALVDQSMGRPVQAIAQTDINGNDMPKIRVAIPIGMTIAFPSNTEGASKNEELKQDDTKIK